MLKAARALAVCVLTAVVRAAGADTLDPAVPTPRSVLGYEIGAYHTDYLGVVRYVEALARAVPDRVRLVPIGHSYERRPMMLLVVSSPANIARLDEVRGDLARLSDPRRTSEDEAEEIVRRSPAVTWNNFGNDGNESAAVEAALEMAYRLAASRGGEVEQALTQVVAVLNVCHNPESRERFVAWYNAHQVGPHGTADPQALEHHGPWGMDTNNNHYQVDLNRDSVWATQQETRNVIAAYRRWNPQTFIDHHGETENFFFPPVALPVNPHIPTFQLEWLERYGKAIAAVADLRGWSYFTKETFDEFYPGYWDAYPLLKGAIGFTFETNAGGSAGLRMQRDDETVITLRDGVDRHVEGGLAVLLMTAAERERKLRDYWRFRKTAVEEGRAGPVRAYAVSPAGDPGRAAALVETLMVHGVEVRRLASPVTVSQARDYLSRAVGTRTLPAGTYLVPLDQPEKRMIHALMEPRTPQQEAFLAEERGKRDRNRRRGRNVPAERDAFYDVTAWALPYAFGVEAYEVLVPVAGGEPLSEPPVPAGGVAGGRAGTAYLFRPDQLGAARLALALLRDGFNVAVARKPFRTAGREWARGTFVVRRERNPEALSARLRELAIECGVEAVAVSTAWSEQGIDLGSAAIDSLKEPRIAVVAGEGTDETAYGAIWFLLERRLGHPFTALSAHALRSADLARYDVIVFPDGSPERYRELLGEEAIKRLHSWVSDGGVAVLSGGAAAMGAHAEVKWTGSRLLGPPEEEEEGGEGRASGEEEPGEDAASAVADGALETERELVRQQGRREEETELTPGAILAADVDEHHFLAYGYGPGPLPVLVASSRVFAASPSGANVVRIRRSDPVLSGFAWPEAAQRLRGAAYLVDEPTGRGHVVLFADDPNFRNFWRGLERLFTNALLLAPSL